jgi:hypothetical protein
MFWEFIVPAIIILFICYYLLPQFHYGVDVQLIKTKSLLHEITHNSNIQNIRNTQNALNINSANQDVSANPEKQRLDKCSASKVEQCPVGTYSQCTNNSIKHGKCNCTDQRSYELCSNDNMDDLLQLDKVLEHDNKKHDKYALRVNQWSVDETAFNDPGNLHIKRLNPYVA